MNKKGQTAAEIKKRLDGVFGDSSPSYPTVKKWVENFRFERESVEDVPHEDLPGVILTSGTNAIIEEEC